RVDGLEELGRARGARAVVPDLQHGRRQRRTRGDQRVLARGLDVGREQERHEPVLDPQHDGLVVPTPAGASGEVPGPLLDHTTYRPVVGRVSYVAPGR